MARIIAIALMLLVAGVITANTVAAKGGPTTVPGWGNGDTNHVHTGPPGQSVRP